MSIYLKIPIVPENPIFTQEAFAARYLELTGEIYVLDNMREVAGVNQMSGSSVCTEEIAIQLKTEFPMVKYYTDFPSTNNWIPKIEE